MLWCCGLQDRVGKEDFVPTTINSCRNFIKWKARRRMRQRQDEESRQDRLLVEEEQEDIGDIPDGELCVVCLLRRRRAAFIYCGHRVCCVGCAQRVEQGPNPRCPVCRQSVNSIVRVFDG